MNIQTAAMQQLQATLAEFSPAEQSLVQSIEEQLAIAIQQQIAIILREKQKQAQTSLQIVPNNNNINNEENCKESQENVCETELETQCTISREEKCSETNCILVEEEDCQLVQVSIILRNYCHRIIGSVHTNFYTSITTGISIIFNLILNIFLLRRNP